MALMQTLFLLSLSLLACTVVSFLTLTPDKLCSNVSLKRVIQLPSTHGKGRTLTYSSNLCMIFGSSKSKKVNPKNDLIELVRSRNLGETESKQKAEEVNRLISKLETRKKGFKPELADGVWQLVFVRNSGKSPTLQQAVSSNQGYQNFDISKKEFYNIQQLNGEAIQVFADVSYEQDNEIKSRLLATISDAGLKLGPVTIPLPFKGREGWLEFVYLDEDVRVTRGDRGGLFVHVRPEIL
mmetsp:Transcript_22897/g.29902  ORF Transcript_22897/g.29902 Transcript_22897/m.29902 type:complete len:239 (-) Transcript_22897:292-1008(-)